MEFAESQDAVELEPASPKEPTTKPPPPPIKEVVCLDSPAMFEVMSYTPSKPTTLAAKPEHNAVKRIGAALTMSTPDLKFKPPSTVLLINDEAPMPKPIISAEDRSSRASRGAPPRAAR